MWIGFRCVRTGFWWLSFVDVFMCLWLPGKVGEYWPNQAINDFPGKVLLYVGNCVKVPGRGGCAHALKAYKGSRSTDPLILYIGTNHR